MARMGQGGKATRRTPPHAFVLEALEPMEPEVRRLFSGYGVYVGDRLVLMLRDSGKQPKDNGLWLVLSETVDPADAELRREFPSARPVGLLLGKITHWLNIPSDSPTFEEESMRACSRILQRDARFGRVPVSRR